MSQTSKETTTTTRMTNLYVQMENDGKKEKYPNKVMIWVVISNRCISMPLFRPS